MTPPRPARPAALLAALALAALGAVSGVALGACGPAGSTEPAAGPADAPSVAADSAYHVWLKLDDVAARVVVTVNGLPVDETYGGRVYDNPALAVPVSSALVSGRNAVAVEAAPYLTLSGSELVVGPVQLRAAVVRGRGLSGAVAGAEITAAEVAAAVAAWEADLQARWAGWSASAGGAALDSAWAWARANPVRVATSFTRPGGAAPSDGEPAFDAALRAAPVIAGTPADSARLRAYAVRLRDLTADRDTAALWAAFEPKYADEYLWWGGQAVIGETRSAFLDRTRGGVVMGGAAPFDEGDVRLRSWAGGRVWELYRDGADGLLQGPGGGPYREVYVGEGPGGALRVVR